MQGFFFSSYKLNMKKVIFILLIVFIFGVTQIQASLPLSGKTIVLDPGHGGKDAGTSYNEILEKDLNLAIALKLKNELIKNGASVIMTREGDYDLSSPDTDRRKKSDFDNRIKLINTSMSDLYLSIHINYLSDSKYSGGQVFYENEDDKILAEFIQKELNTISYPRSIKQMPDIYMYQYLKIPGVLIECGFISNTKEREKLVTDEYQKILANKITNGVISYFT